MRKSLVVKPRAATQSTSQPVCPFNLTELKRHAFREVAFIWGGASNAFTGFDAMNAVKWPEKAEGATLNSV